MQQLVMLQRTLVKLQMFKQDSSGRKSAKFIRCGYSMPARLRAVPTFTTWYNVNQNVEAMAAAVYLKL